MTVPSLVPTVSNTLSSNLYSEMMLGKRYSKGLGFISIPANSAVAIADTSVGVSTLSQNLTQSIVPSNEFVVVKASLPIVIGSPPFIIRTKVPAVKFVKVSRTPL